VRELPALLLLAVALLAGDVKTTASGLQYEVLREGKPGTTPVAGDDVVVHYTGWLVDGTKFDSSVDRGQPLRFPLGRGRVIAGWDEGVALMTVGSKFRFTIPPELAYGDQGNRSIPPKATLVFEVELLDVPKPPPFPKGDPAKQTTTASGLRFEVLAPGEGEPARKDQGVRIRFALWTADGRLLECTEQHGKHLTGTPAMIPLRFFEEAALMMRPRSTYRFEVPPELFESPNPAVLPKGSTTVWQFHLEAVNDVPAFVKPDPAALKTTGSGLSYEVLAEGAGKAPDRRGSVKLHYTGWLEDGTIFDSSHARGEPQIYRLHQLIAGWSEGLLLMKEGARYRLVIPANLAYRDRPPRGSRIPKGATLVLLVDLIQVGG
jgi:FKBP-type peptidyl-prolyl cis-trans isomerase